MVKPLEFWRMVYIPRVKFAFKKYKDPIPLLRLYTSDVHAPHRRSFTSLI